MQAEMYKDKDEKIDTYVPGKGGSAVLDRGWPETEQGGGSSGGKSGRGGSSGDGGDGGSGGQSEPSDNRRMLENEKYALKGMFAKDIVDRILPYTFGSSPFAELANINMIREKLNGKMPFKTAFDLNTRRMHFYVMDKTFGPEVADKFKDLTNEDNGMFESTASEQTTLVKLNQNAEYVKKNIIRDVKDVGSLTAQTAIPEDATFISYDVVENFIRQTLKEENAGTISIDEV